MGAFKSIYTDYACEPSQTLVGPKLTLEANAAGSLEFSVLPGQDGYDNIYTRPRHGYLVVLKDGEPIWDGRVTTRDMDWNNSKSIYAEGALSYLNDIMIQSLEDTSDFKTARANAQTDLKKKESAYNKAKKAWEDGGSVGTGDLYNKYITAKKNLGCAKKNYANCAYNANILDPTDDELLLELIEDDYYGENGPKIFEMMLEKYNAQAENSNVHNQFVLGDVFVPAIHEAYEAVDEDDYLIEWDSPDFTTVYEYFSSMLQKIPNTYLSVTYEYDANNLLVRKLNWLLQGVNQDNVKAVKQYYNTNVKSAKTAYSNAAEVYNRWYVTAYESAKDATDIEATIKSNSEYATKHDPLVTATNNLKTVNAAWNTYIKSLVDYSSPDIVVKQTVNFGENLLDFKRNIDSTEMFTRLIPIGEDDLYLNDDKSSAAIYVQDNELVAQYGVITRKMNFDKIRDVKTLKQQAKAELAKMKARIDGSKESIEITALDLRYYDSTAYYGKSLNIFDVVDCISAPHGFLTSNKFPVLKEEIDMAQPENTKFTLNAIIEYQSATSQLASTSGSAMATASTVSTLGARQNSNITYSSVKVNPIVASGIELATINDISIYAPRGEEVYYGTSLPTADIGQDSSLYYKTIQRPEDLKTLNVVEYITAAAGAYIPTDICPTTNTRIEMVGWFTTGDWHGFNKAFGTEGNTDSNHYGRVTVVTSAFESNSKAEFWYGNDSWYLQRYAQMPINQKCTIICDIPTRTCYFNGTESSAQITVPEGFIYQDSLTPLAILHTNKSSTVGGMEVQSDYRDTNGGARIYRFRIYQNGVLAYDMIPVINANNPEDGGLYDRIHRKYYPGEWAQTGILGVKFTGSNPTGEVINQLDECVETGYLRVNDEWWEIYNGGTEYFAGNYIEITENNVITSTLKAGTNIQIADDGTISASINIIQTLTEGTEIAQINGTSLYAPSGSDVTVTPKTSTGTNIADISVDGTTYQLFAPSGGGGGGSGSGYTKTILWSGYKSDTGTITLSDNVENYDVVLIKLTSHPSQPSTQYYESYFTILPSDIVYNQSAQYCLLAIRATAHYGDGSLDCYFSSSTSFVIETISIDQSARQVKPAVLEVIGLKFGGGSGHNYSTNEQVVGTWIDGSTIYEKTQYGGITFSTQGTWYDTDITNIDKVVSVEGSIYRDGEPINLGYWNRSIISCWILRDHTLKLAMAAMASGEVYRLNSITVRYTKTSTASSDISVS